MRPYNWISLALLCLGLSLAPGCDFDGPGVPAVEGSFQKTLPVSGPADLDVQTNSGSIRLTAGEPGNVRVSATIRARAGWMGNDRDAEERVRRLEKDPPVEQTGNTIRIGRISDPDLRRHVTISYDLVVPAETRVRASTGSGSESIEGVRGPVTASTGSGGITIANIGDEVRATTGSGSIKLDAVKGRIHASTGSGGIRGAGLAGAVTANTGSGTIRIEQTGNGNVDVETGSGGIEISGVRGAVRARSGSGSATIDGEAAGDWDVDLGSGGVTVRLPPSAAFDLHARTGSGSITSDHPVTVEGDLGKNKRELRGKVRGGGPRLNLRTASGGIRIH